MCAWWIIEHSHTNFVWIKSSSSVQNLCCFLCRETQRRQTAGVAEAFTAGWLSCRYQLYKHPSKYLHIINNWNTFWRRQTPKMAYSLDHRICLGECKGLWSWVVSQVVGSMCDRVTHGTGRGGERALHGRDWFRHLRSNWLLKMQEFVRTDTTWRGDANFVPKDITNYECCSNSTDFVESEIYIKICVSFRSIGVLTEIK